MVPGFRRGDLFSIPPASDPRKCFQPRSASRTVVACIGAPGRVCCEVVIAYDHGSIVRDAANADNPVTQAMLQFIRKHSAAAVK